MLSLVSCFAFSNVGKNNRFSFRELYLEFSKYKEDKSALPTIIPKKSRSKYDLPYAKFSLWCEHKNITHWNEKV